MVLCWGLFASAIGLHFWVGGVIVDTKASDAGYFYELRENRGIWEPMGVVTYYACHLTRTALSVVCCAAALWALARWARRGKFIGPTD